LGMVVFRLKGPNDLTEALLKKINTSGKLHCVPAALKVRSKHQFLFCFQFDYKFSAIPF
jgi:histidine decarboxylase